MSYDPEYHRRYYRSNRDRILAYGAKRQRDKVVEVNAYHRKYRRGIREEVITHYGGACTCCGERRLQFLTLDHESGKGNEHRRTFSSKQSNDPVYRWIRKNNFPAGYSILCWNCNCGRSINGGICPHKQETEEHGSTSEIQS